MVPDKLVGVEIRRIAWQKVQFDPPLHLINELRHYFSPMRWMAIQDQEDGVPACPKKVLEKAEKTTSIQGTCKGSIPETPTCIDGRDGIDGLTLAAGLDHRRLSPRSPGSPERRIGTNSCFIQEEDVSPTGLGTAPQLRILHLQPVRDRLRISLVGP